MRCKLLGVWNKIICAFRKDGNVECVYVDKWPCVCDVCVCTWEYVFAVRGPGTGWREGLMVLEGHGSCKRQHQTDGWTGGRMKRARGINQRRRGVKEGRKSRGLKVQGTERRKEGRR